MAIFDSWSGRVSLIKSHLSRNLDASQDDHSSSSRREGGSQSDIWGKNILESPICSVKRTWT